MWLNLPHVMETSLRANEDEINNMQTENAVRQVGSQFSCYKFTLTLLIHFYNCIKRSYWAN